jgi:5-methylcytosine-specific restriction protein A
LIREEYELDLIKDLRPVCPNCHAMLHRNKDVISIKELIAIVDTYGNNIRDL